MSDRKKSKDQLISELQRLRAHHVQMMALLKLAPGFAGVTEGPEHTFTFANQGLTNWVGGRDLDGLSFREALPQLADRLPHGLLDSVYGGGEVLVGSEISLITDEEDQDAREVLLDFAMVPLRDLEGNVTGVASYAADVTDKVHAKRRMALMRSELHHLEAQTSDLRDENTQLKQELRHREAQLERLESETQADISAMQRALVNYELQNQVRSEGGTDAGLQSSQLESLKQADALRDAMMGVISHELRTPAHVLLGYGTILAKELNGQLTSVQQGYLNKMLGSADVLADLINDILAYGQLKSGAFRLSTRLIDFTEVLDEAVAKYQPSIARKGLKLTTRRSADAALLMGDQLRLSQVVSKILDNAVKFTPAGGEISVSVRSEGGQLFCEIKDTGIGIAEEALPGLFEPFADATRLLNRSERGCGMGLMLSKAFTEAHGGRLEVQSTQGMGTLLRVTFPLLDDRLGTTFDLAHPA